MMSRINIYKVVVMTTLFLFVSAEWVTAQTVTHPIKKNIPYINEEAIPLSTDKRIMNPLLEEFSNEGEVAPTPH